MTQDRFGGGTGKFESTRVLVAEDDPFNQSLIRSIFDDLGCTADIVGDGVEAIRLFQMNRYDAVFMDCQMPNLDGLAATRKIREFERRRAPSVPVPIIAFTANTADEECDKCLSAGMDGLLTKPFTIEDLSTVLERWTLG